MGSEPSRTYSRVFSLRGSGQVSVRQSEYCAVDTHDVSKAFASTVCAEIRQYDTAFAGNRTGDANVSRSGS